MISPVLAAGEIPDRGGIVDHEALIEVVPSRKPQIGLIAAAQHRHFEFALLPPARRTGYLAGLDR